MVNYTVQQLEYFFTIAELGSIARAAECLFVTQPTLSKTVRRLEDGLGFQLFERKANQLHLTSEGEYFYYNAKPLYQKMNVLINTAQNMSQGQNLLRLGYFSGANRKLIEEIIKTFKDKNPNIEILLNAMDRRDLRENLSAGKLDLIFSLSYAVNKIANSKTKAVDKTKFFLVMRADNEMAKTQKLDYEYLEQSTMFFCSANDTQLFEQNDLNRCIEIGFRPKKRVYLENHESCLCAVERGEGLCLGAEKNLRNGLYAFEIPWIKNTPELLAVWLSHNNSAALKRFVAELPDIE